jgi:hypothetical protein
MTVRAAGSSFLTFSLPTILKRHLRAAGRLAGLLSGPS